MGVVHITMILPPAMCIYNCIIIQCPVNTCPCIIVICAIDTDMTVYFAPCHVFIIVYTYNIMSCKYMFVCNIYVSIILEYKMISGIYPGHIVWPFLLPLPRLLPVRMSRQHAKWRAVGTQGRQLIISLMADHELGFEPTHAFSTLYM